MMTETHVVKTRHQLAPALLLSQKDDPKIQAAYDATFLIPLQKSLRDAVREAEATPKGFAGQAASWIK